MAKDLPKAQALHEAGASLKTQDCRQWTLLHYAELQNDEVMASWLRTQCVALECMRNAEGLTPLGVRARTLIPCPEGTQTVFAYKDSDHTVKAGTAAQFHEMTRARFSPHIMITPMGMAAEWTDAIQQKETVVSRVLVPLFARAYKKAFERFQVAPPRLFLSHSSSIGYGLHAGEAIGAGEVITYYGGVIDGKDKRSSGVNPYLWVEKVDGRSVRNLGPMANDSTPNAEIVELENRAGLPACPVLIALVPIGANEQIVVDYGAFHPAKLQHCELRQEALETYFRAHALPDVAQLAASKDPGTFIAHLLPQAMYKYLLSTPSALMHLLLKQIVTPEQVTVSTTRHLDVRAEGVDTFYKLSSRGILVKFAQSVQPRVGDEVITALLRLNNEAPFIASLKVMMYLITLNQNPSALENEQILSMIPPIKVMGEAVHTICLDGRQGRFNGEAWLCYMKASMQLPEASLPYFMFFMKDLILDRHGLTRQSEVFIRQLRE
ncbi:MAG: hypothetical protein S4CHLAM2_05560 [Chlamydiales bacterium]|nr:hypothetical protein [Chlamydiales bacterium]